jgi:hypothetical protein
VRRILVDDQHFFDKGGPFIEKSRALVGNGLATCPASAQAKQRLMMQPAFHHTRFP